MTSRILSTSAVAAFALAMWWRPASAGAQQLSATPRPAPESKATSVAAKPDPASMPTPHAPDGHPDLSGVWYHREPGPPVEQRADGTIVYEFPGIEKDPTAKLEVGNEHPSPTKNNMPAY